MTNTDTADVTSTVNQVMALARAGSELVRVTVNTEAAAAAVPKIVDTLELFGVRVPDHRRLPLQRPYPAEEISGVRARAGEIPDQSRQRQYRQEARRQFPHHDRSRHRVRQAVRIGVNWGSLDQRLLTRMMDENNRARRAERRPRGDARRHRGQRARIGRARPSATACPPTASSSAPKSAACRI